MNWRRINILFAIVAILGAAAAAHALVPHRTLAMRPSQDQLEAMIPGAFNEWSPVPGVKILEPPGSDTLSKQIYSAELSRGYRDSEGHLIMLVVAYGASQSDRLQLHRPEICYAAQGFRITKSASQSIEVGDGRPALPVRRLIAQREERLEPITYWMRLGDMVATGATSRQILKVKYGLSGYIVDGALVRVSAVGLPSDRAFELEASFVRDLLNAVDGDTRRFLVGQGNPSGPFGF